MGNILIEFEKELYRRGRSMATAEKYVRDAAAFLKYTKGETTRESVLSYKVYLCENYLPKSVNSMLAGVNCYLEFAGVSQCRVGTVKIQRRTFAERDRELTKAEYERLLEAAREKPRLYYLLQTICSTGIRA